MASFSPIQVKGNSIIISDYSDTISMLPDEILSHILSFLPTNHAVSTSVLSKRWKSVWTYVSNIKFDDKSFNPYYAHKVHSCMYKVLKELKVKRIRAFSFDASHECFCDFNDMDIEEWIRDAIKLKVEQLELSSTHHQIITLPRVLFTNATTLVELKLCGSIGLQHLPVAACFPTLKILYLVKFGLNDECVPKLIARCSALEKLYIKISPWSTSSWSVCSISSSSLTHLKLVNDHRWWHNGESQKVELNVPNIRYICTRNDKGSIDLSVMGRLSSLFEADIVLSNVDMPEKNFGREILPGVLKHFDKVKTLTIPSYILKALNFAPIDTFAIFQNVTHLKIKAELCNWNLLSYILERSLNLQVLTFSKGTYSSKKISERSWYEPRHVPKCVASSLRLISIHGYQGVHDEFQMVKYFLENAQVLERMEIRVAFGARVRCHLYRKIQMLNRVDTTCEIVIC